MTGTPSTRTSFTRYGAFPPVDLPDRTWPAKRPEQHAELGAHLFEANSGLGMARI